MIFKASLLLTTLLCLRVAQSSDEGLPTGLTDLSDGSKMEEYIRNNLDRIRSMMINGNASYNIPPLDPYRQDESLPHRFEFSTSMAEGALEVNDVVVTGMSKFELKSLEVDSQKKSIQFEFEVPNIKLSGQYTDQRYNRTGR
ncbi:Uncharacterised protein r2_g2430 [Pycnogonum litorale]